jgi:hypothetical protein
MADTLTFSNFDSRTFNLITELLCDVFITTEPELKSIYQELIDDFDKDGWPPHCVERTFFESYDKEFQKTFEISPSVAVDLPSLFELKNEVNNKPTVVILGQDPKSNQNFEEIGLGTPYGLYHKGSREVLKRTRLYFDMISILLKLNYKVHLTDIFKIWVCDPDQPYYGIELPKEDRDKFVAALKSELLIVNPAAVVTWGKRAEKSVVGANLYVKHLSFPHPSGAANGTWKKLI